MHYNTPPNCSLPTSNYNALSKAPALAGRPPFSYYPALAGTGFRLARFHLRDNVCFSKAKRNGGDSFVSAGDNEKRDSRKSNP